MVVLPLPGRWPQTSRPGKGAARSVAARGMRVQNRYPSQAEFRISRPQNFLVVQNWADQVVVRAARDNFSDRRKRLFVRHLAAEGFIPDRYELLALGGGSVMPGIEWIIMQPQGSALDSHRRALRQVLLTILWATLLWLSLMLFAFLHAA